MGVDEEHRLYEGPKHEWRLPIGGRPLSFALLVVAAWAVGAQVFFAAAEVAVHGFVRAETARAFAVAGLVFLVFANVKSIALAMRREVNEALAGLLDILLPRLWLVHFWLNPLAVFSIGMFLLCTPRAQPPFYFVAYGILLWQTLSGLLGRQALRLRGREASVGRSARAAHHQPAVYVLLAVLVAAGFVDSLFP